MGLRHYNQDCKHTAPGAATNDILVYNGSDFDPKSRETALTGLTLPTLTVTALTTTNTLTIFGHAAAAQQTSANAVTLTTNYLNDYAAINVALNLCITALKNLGLTA